MRNAREFMSANTNLVRLCEVHQLLGRLSAAHAGVRRDAALVEGHVAGGRAGQLLDLVLTGPLAAPRGFEQSRPAHPWSVHPC